MPIICEESKAVTSKVAVMDRAKAEFSILGLDVLKAACLFFRIYFLI
jgi:hypothetical protein